jgi:hypothetical protein
MMFSIVSSVSSMKTTIMKRTLAIFSATVLICTSCNIKQPLKDILTEANVKPADCIRLDSKVDTLFLAQAFPTLVRIDSVIGHGLAVVPMVENSSYRVEVVDSMAHFHGLDVYKGGKWVTVMTLYQDTATRLVQDPEMLTSKGMLNKRLLFEFNKRPVEFYAIWQNVVLPSSFITFGKNNVSVQLPKETNQIKESCIRIFASDGKRMGF